MDFPITHIRPKEVILEISKLNNKKTPGYDKISAKDIKLFPKKAVLYLTLIYNSIMRLQYFPLQWKCAEIVMVPKPNKPQNLKEFGSFQIKFFLLIFSVSHEASL